MTDRELMQLALEALEYANTGNRRPEVLGRAITAIKEALAQPEQAPMRYFRTDAEGNLNLTDIHFAEPAQQYSVTSDHRLMENAQGELERIKLVQTGVGIGKPEQCQCPACKVTPHASDCSVHNEPAYPKGACNCGAQPEQEPVAWRYLTQYESGASIWTYCAGEPANRETRQPLYTSPPVQRCKYGNEPVSCTSSPMDCQCAIDAVFEQQEPIAYAVYHRMGGSKTLHWPEQHSEDGDHNEYQLVPLYASPQPSKPWVGLTDDEIERACVPLGAAMLSFTEVARAIEAKLREKNT